MLVQCKQCGAPLDVKPEDRLVRCTYCEATNRVRSMQTLQNMTPVNWQPPPVWTPPPQFPIRSHAPLQVHAVKPPSANRAGCIVGFITLAGILPAVIVPLASSGLGASLPWVGLDTETGPLIAAVDLPEAARTLNGTTATDVDASSVEGTGTCRGHVPRRAHALLRLREAATVRLTADATFDTTMIVRRADGTFLCDDDSGQEALNPEIVAALPAGEHRVWVGQFSTSTGGPFTLDVVVDGAPLSGGSTLMPDARPTLAAFVAEGTLRDLRGGQVRGVIDTSTMGSRCRGFVAAAPTATIEASSAQRMQLRTTDSTGDVVMLVRSPSGAIACDDDSGGGHESQIDLHLEPGRTAIWVGTFSRDAQLSYTLRVNHVGPDVNGAPVLATVLLDEAPEVTTYSGTTSPEHAAGDLDRACRGFIGERPDLVLLNETPRDVELTTISRADLVLVVRGPDGRFVCDDDSGGGQNAQIHQRWEAGTHQVWVGSYSQRERVSFQLRMREQSAPTRRRVDHRIK